MKYVYLRLLCLLLALGLAACSDSDGNGSVNNGGSSSSSSSSSSAGLPEIETAFFGTAPGGTSTYEHLLTYFDQITPENAGKWESVEADQDVMVWDGLDTAYQFAQDNNLPFKFHVLVWGQQQPSWMDDDTLTNEEKLAEIDEWMAAVAERYPDLELVEVVNEPLHAKPEYREALGGDGETGWDWVVTAFEMAREHFPDATLILNDYQILHLEQFTADYLEIIEILQAAELIDAIGVQAHFLERTQASMVQTNLDTLAETGLPIYVSEFDLNLADDARHANKMAELFPVFWDHPRVAGVTHWGHLEGTTWREDGYLVNADGSERDALTWIVCYMAGNGDACTVPEYVPSGWQGDEYGVTLEAELYDEGEGLVALGEQVAYTNPGDWIVFRGVEFQSGWDKLWLTYTRGLDEDNGATITVHLGSLENAPVKTIPVPFTGGWSGSDTLQIDWTPISTTEDVFLRFNEDEEAVANVDNIRFGRPRPVSDINLVSDGGFEGGSVDGGWNAFGNSSVFALTSSEAYEGSQSMEVTGRSGTGGYAAYSLTGKVSTGTSYSVSVRVLHDGTGDDVVTLTSKVACNGELDSYTTLQSNSAVAPDAWTKLSGNLVVPAGCDITEVQVYLEGTDPANTVYVDEAKVAPANFVGDGGFEGVALDSGWSDFSSGASLSLSTAQFNGGAQSLFADRSSATNGTGGFAAYWLTDVMTPGLTYLASAQVYQTGSSGSETVRLVAQVACEGESDAYLWVEENTSVPDTTWTQLSGDFEIPLDCDINQVQLYLEGPTAGVDVYVDDVSVTLPADNLVTDGEFEGGSLDGGWGTWYQSGTSLSLSTDQAVSGSQSMLAGSRAENSNPSYDLTSLVEAGTTYSVSAQAMHTAGAPDDLTLTYKLACDGESDVYSQVASETGVASATWTELSGTMSIPAGCSVTESRIYFEGTTTGVDVYIDDVSVTAN